MIFKKVVNHFWFSAGLLVLSAQCESGTMGDVDSFRHRYQPLATITLGADFVQKSRAQTLTLLPPFQNHYTSATSGSSAFDGGLFLGFERAFSQRLQVQIGVSGYGDSNITPSGDVWQFALPVFDNLSYSYRIEHARAMVSGKVLTSLSKHQAIHPYLSGELGVAFNRASSYQEIPLTDGAVPMTPFANHTQNSFSYGVGLGVDYSVNPHLRIGAGYQFADLGRASLGITTAASTTETLSLPHLYTNQLRFQFTYLV